MVYSDIGFILLGHLLEELGKARLDTLFFKYIATELNLTAGFRSLSPAPPMPPEMAPTGVKRPRDPAPGQEGMWEVAQVYSGLGEVDDDNAWAMGGVAGHAGLFGTALDVAVFGQAVLEGRFAPPNGRPWEVDPETAGSTRALGFEVPGLDLPSCGMRFGRAGPKGAIGHTGFTGVSLWIDFDRKLVVSLCTNRVALGRLNLKIRGFRPEFHEAVLDELKL
jgi:CubicO group peptidase (beta-lactamase class C family)